MMAMAKHCCENDKTVRELPWPVSTLTCLITSGHSCGCVLRAT